MQKIVFFVKGGLDNFLHNVISVLSNEYETKKVVVTNYNQIEEAMKWADICWFEWCDELIVYGSKLEIAEQKIILCRLHSYEAFTEYIMQVNWSNVDKLICVSEFIKNNVLSKTNMDKEKIIVIPNGIDVNKYMYKERKKGFNIAFIGYINYKKGPMLLLHTFKAIYEKDNRYKLFIAGTFQDERYVLYFNHMIKEMGLRESVIYEGWQQDLNTWMEDKEYILCTSLLESQNVSVMQAMSKGIKPIIHNFVGAKDVYPTNYLWTSIDEAVNMVGEDKYDSKEYRNFVVNSFSVGIQKQKINRLIHHLWEKEHITERELPLVTVGIINYNYGHFLDHAIKSVLNQKYGNIEILIADDFSTDGSIEKIKEYENKYANIKGIYHFQNSGSAVTAFRDIIHNASGEYLVFLSADDYFFDDSVIANYVQEFIKDSNLDYVYGNIQVVDEEGNRKETWKYRDYTDEEIVYNTFRNMGSGVIPLTTGMVKLDFYYKNKLSFVDDPNNRVAGDTLNTLVYVKHGWKRKYIDMQTLCYRHHNYNMTYDLENRIKSIISVMEYVIDNFNVSNYFPEVKWSEISGIMKEQEKMYIIGEYYWKVLVEYYNGKVKIFSNPIAFDKEQLREYIQPLIKVIEKYFDKCTEISQVFSEKIKNIKAQLSTIKIQSNILSIGSKKNEIYYEGQRLRQDLLREYKNKHSGKSLKILIHAPENGAWKYGFMAWKEIFEYMGAKVTILSDINDDLVEGYYDIFFNIADKYYIEKAITNNKVVAIPHKIGLISKQDFLTRSECTDLDLLSIDLIKDLKYDFLVSSFSTESINVVFKRWLDNSIKIKSIPFGFNPLIYYPENSEERYDYFFIGSNSYMKIEETKKYLIPIINNYKGILRGTNWSEKIPELHPGNSRFFYNRTKINLNYHLKSQKEFENEINERTFVISACGGFQLIDNPKILGKYYSNNEMIIARDEKDYIDKFFYYLNKPKERHEIAFNSLLKTYEKKYSLFHRIENIISHI
jgi:glycosyltransferase involved in cell wall biosynthesis